MTTNRARTGQVKPWICDQIDARNQLSKPIASAEKDEEVFGAQSRIVIARLATTNLNTINTVLGVSLFRPDHPFQALRRQHRFDPAFQLLQRRLRQPCFRPIGQCAETEP